MGRGEKEGEKKEGKLDPLMSSIGVNEEEVTDWISLVIESSASSFSSFFPSFSEQDGTRIVRVMITTEEVTGKRRERDDNGSDGVVDIGKEEEGRRGKEEDGPGEKDGETSNGGLSVK